MIAAAPTIRVLASSDRRQRPRQATLLAACAAIEAIPSAILLLGTALPPALEVSAAAFAHGTAVLLLFVMVHARPSSRWLCVAAMLAVPFVGAAVAVAILLTRGRVSAAARRRRKPRRRPAFTMAAMRRLGGALSPCDALDCGDEEQRRAALLALARRDDSEAIALLRRAAAGRDPDLALSAALALDEIGERAERHVNRPAPVEARYGVG